MKTINDYISERLNPRNLGPYIKEFPFGKSIKETILFLRYRGFEEIENPWPTSYKIIEDYIPVFNKCKRKGFIAKFITIGSETGLSLLFADTSKSDIDDDNPLVYMWFEENKPKDYWIIHHDNAGGNVHLHDDKFRFFINQYFE